MTWPLLLELEKCRYEECPFAGMSLGRKKFFDLLRRPLCFRLLEELGMPVQMLRLEKELYERLKYRYKLSGALSEQWEKTTGFIQGRSFSVEAALAIMAVWSYTVEKEANVQPSSFLDDSSAYSRGEGCEKNIKKAWALSLEYDEKAGTELNIQKSLFYACDAKYERKLRALIGKNTKVKFVTSFVLLGVDVNVRGRYCRKRRNKVIKQVKSTAAKVALAPISSKHKANVVASACGGKIAFNTEVYANSATTRRSLRAAFCSATRPKGKYFMSPGLMQTLVAKGHLIDPAQSEDYHALRLWSRMLKGTSASELKQLWTDTWTARQACEDEQKKKVHGPVRRLDDIRANNEWEWLDAVSVKRRKDARSTSTAPRTNSGCCTKSALNSGCPCGNATDKSRSGAYQEVTWNYQTPRTSTTLLL